MLGGHERRADDDARKKQSRSRLTWIGYTVVGIATAVASVLWYQRAASNQALANQSHLAAIAAEIADLVGDRLSNMQLRLAVADSAAASGNDITITRLPLDGSDTRIPLRTLMAAAGSGQDPGTPGLTPPYQLDGQWYAALVDVPEPRGTLAAITPLSGLRLQIDELVRSSGGDALIVSSANWIWWTSPLDEALLNLPITTLAFTAASGGEMREGGGTDVDRLSQWRSNENVAEHAVPGFGLSVFVRGRASRSGSASLDYTGLALILATGCAGLVGCTMAFRGAVDQPQPPLARDTPPMAVPQPQQPAERATEQAAAMASVGPIASSVANGLLHETPEIPFFSYVVQSVAPGVHQMCLLAISAPDRLGLGINATELPIRKILERVADQQQHDFEDFLIGKVSAESAPQWLDWDVEGGDSTVLLHLPFIKPASENQPAKPGGLLISADSHYADWTRMESSVRDANAANTRKSRFLARLSHELRTPLNAIIGFAELMEHETLGPIGTPRYKDYLSDIGASGRHLHDLINDIIDISRVETGELDLSESILPIRSELEACVRFIRERLDASKLEFVADVPDRLPKLRADPLRFRQIMLNLLSNAIKFTKPGGKIGLSVRITSDSSLKIAVVDTGIGMDEDGLRRAIEPFGRIADEQYGPTEGTGLGLPIARGLLALHGGRLEIESAPGAGTTVDVIFPSSRLIAVD